MAKHVVQDYIPISGSKRGNLRQPWAPTRAVVNFLCPQYPHCGTPPRTANPPPKTTGWTPSVVPQPQESIDRFLLFYAQSTTKGHIRAKQNVFLQVNILIQHVFLPQVNILIHYFIHIPPLRIGEIWGN